jgi:hypothetical protein
MCGSIKTGVHCCPRWVAPIKRHPELRANQGVEYVRCHDIIAAQFLVMRGPHGYHIFASVLWPCRTGYSSEPIDMTVARGIAGEAYSRYKGSGQNRAHPEHGMNTILPATLHTVPHAA